MKKSTQMGLSLGTNIITSLVISMGGAIWLGEKFPEYKLLFIILGMVISFGLIALLLIKFIKLADAEARENKENEK